MKIYLGKTGIKKSHQLPFEEEIECIHCWKEARLAFVGHEDEGPFVCDLHENKPREEGCWPHDTCAVAVYICKDCMKTTSRMNQG